MTRYTAHVDTFARDNLPPAAAWPELLFELPELQYPAGSIAPPSFSTSR